MRLRSVREPGRVFNSQLTLGLYKGLFNIIQFIRSQLTVAGLLHVFDRPEAMQSTDYSSVPLYICINARRNVFTAGSSGRRQARIRDGRHSRCDRRRVRISSLDGAHSPDSLKPNSRDWDSRYLRAKRDQEGLKAHIGVLAAEV